VNGTPSDFFSVMSVKTSALLETGSSPTCSAAIQSTDANRTVRGRHGQSGPVYRNSQRDAATPTHGKQGHE
jgi:hypothetical protein